MQSQKSLKRKSSLWSDFQHNLQKVWISSRENSSSAKSISDNSTILFFEYFLRTPIFLDHEWTYYVKPKYWAIAFLQCHLVDITVALCQVVFKQEDLNVRDENGELLENAQRLDRLDQTKRNAIKYAAYWMKNKEQDPWSYEPPETPPKISKEDLDQIELGFLKVSKVVDQGETLYSQWMKVDKDYTRADRGYFMGRPETPFDKEFNSNMHESLKRILADELDFSSGSSTEEIYKTVMGLSLKKQKVALNLLLLSKISNCSQAVQVLTEMAIANPDELTDVFFDPVQVSKTHLLILEKRRHAGIGEMVRSLFRMVYRRYKDDQDPQNPLSTFENLDKDSCASVLLLSVIRGVKRLVAFCPEEESFCQFITQDTRRSNIFLSREEFDEVSDILRSAWGEAKLGSVDPKISRSDEVLCDRFQHALSIQSSAIGPVEMITDFNEMHVDGKEKVNQQNEVIKCITIQQAGKCMVLGSYPKVRFPMSLLHKAFSAFGLEKGSPRGNGESEAGKVLLVDLFTNEELLMGSLLSLSSRKRISSTKPLESHSVKRVGFFTHEDFRERSHALIRMVKVLSALANEDGSLARLNQLADGEQTSVVAETCINDKHLRENIFVEFQNISLRPKMYDKRKVKE